jgi:hypothetical protein
MGSPVPISGIRFAMSDYESEQRNPDERENDYALDKGNLDEAEDAKEEDLQREREPGDAGSPQGDD